MPKSGIHGGTFWLLYSLIAAAISIPAVVAGQGLFTFPDRGKVIAAPAVDEPAGKASSKIAVFAGGCFWGVQGVYQHVKGVTSAVSGYAGGDKSTAQYEVVETGTTGHAESVQVTFDPRQISYGRLLQIYFSVVHDPTQLDRQGPDVGPQYRSAIFPLNAQQERIARAYITQLGDAHVFETPIVTKVEMGRSFYAAEAHHQDFLTRNPRNQYIVVNDLPKIKNLSRLFTDSYRQEPMLALASR